MISTDQRERNAAIERARERARRNLAQAHPDEYRRLLEAACAAEGVTPPRPYETSER